MPKVVRIIALIMAILMGLSAIGMIAMYVAAESLDSGNTSASLAIADAENNSCNVADNADSAILAVKYC